MKVSEVTLVDGRMCAQLLNLLKLGRWDLSGADITAHGETVRWVQFLASNMSEQLKSTKPTDQTMKVKAMGSLPGPSPKKPTGKKK